MEGIEEDKCSSDYVEESTGLNIETSLSFGASDGGSGENCIEGILARLAAIEKRLGMN